MAFASNTFQKEQKDSDTTKTALLKDEEDQSFGGVRVSNVVPPIKEEAVIQSRGVRGQVRRRAD